MGKRKHQIVFLGTFLPWCWLAMMAAHELGHVLAAVATGGTVVTVVLHPLAISRTDVCPNPMPLVVAWAGPAVGVLLPLGIWRVHCIIHVASAYITRFYAGFCLLANGAYIGAGSFYGVGDAGDLLRLGVPRVILWGFGGLAIIVGLTLWNRLGPHFGFGASGDFVSPVAACVSAVLFVVTVAIMVALG